MEEEEAVIDQVVYRELKSSANAVPEQIDLESIDTEIEAPSEKGKQKSQIADKYAEEKRKRARDVSPRSRLLMFKRKNLQVKIGATLAQLLNERDLALLRCTYVCPVCGYGCVDIEQAYCPACNSPLDRGMIEGASKQFQDKVASFFSQFDRQENLPDLVRTYLYSTQIKPFFLKNYRILAEKWYKLVSAGSIVVPACSYETISDDQVLALCREFFELARWWASEEMEFYVVDHQSQVERSDYLRAMLGHAWQLLGHYHSRKAVRTTSFAEISNSYQVVKEFLTEAQRTISRISIPVEEFTRLNKVILSGLALVERILTYPQEYSKAGELENPIPVELSSDYQAYEDYRKIYSQIYHICSESLIKARELRKLARRQEKRMRGELEKLWQELQQRIKALGEEYGAKKRMLENTLLVLTDKERRIAQIAKYMMILPLLFTASLLFIARWLPHGEEKVPWVGLIIVGIGLMNFSYLIGYSHHGFQGKMPFWFRILQVLFAVFFFIGVVLLGKDFISWLFWWWLRGK